MKNLGEMMKQVQEMQSRMQEMQAKLETLMIDGQSGGGLVKVTLNGKGVLTAVSVDASLLKPEEKEILEDLIVAAHADAQAEWRLLAEQMKEMTGGLPLPPGFQLPHLLERVAPQHAIHRSRDRPADPDPGQPAGARDRARPGARRCISSRTAKSCWCRCCRRWRDRARRSPCARVCGNVDTIDPCTLCTDPRRDRSIICVVEEVGDLWALERAGAMAGLYHVLGGTLSALDGVTPEDLAIATLVERVARRRRQGSGARRQRHRRGPDHRALHHRAAAGLGVTVSRLAHGVPVGGELDYLDEGTLTAAMRQRRPF